MFPWFLEFVFSELSISGFLNFVVDVFRYFKISQNLNFVVSGLRFPELLVSSLTSFRRVQFLLSTFRVVASFIILEL